MAAFVFKQVAEITADTRPAAVRPDPGAPWLVNLALLAGRIIIARDPAIAVAGIAHDPTAGASYDAIVARRSRYTPCAILPAM